LTRDEKPECHLFVSGWSNFFDATTTNGSIRQIVLYKQWHHFMLYIDRQYGWFQPYISCLDAGIVVVCRYIYLKNMEQWYNSYENHGSSFLKSNWVNAFLAFFFLITICSEIANLRYLTLWYTSCSNKYEVMF
jgi:hypothetical protein